ncbi:MAG: 2-dehydro-3-deoxygalactonokinase [Sphingomonadales bacterium]|nr:2-dehydro-3-deoxygalactonokinase [Sphingomonadales bacterium]
MTGGWRILGDWGTTRLRLWRLVAGAVIDRHDGPGIGALDGTPADTLRAAIAPWRTEHGAPARIGLCGMAGARNGLHEAGYVECPAGVADWRQGAARLAFDGVPLTIAAGMASARDVMRGEETQVFGALARSPELAQGAQVVALPGTHSKWVWLDDGCIVALRTFMTGELFALLQRSSLFAAGSAEGEGGDGFAAGLALARETPGVLGNLFQPRIAQLRQGKPAAWARELLSGLLIGGEPGELRAAGLLPDRVSVIAAPALAARYGEALAGFGVASVAYAGDDGALAGLELLDADDR